MSGIRNTAGSYNVSNSNLQVTQQNLRTNTRSSSAASAQGNQQQSPPQGGYAPPPANRQVHPLARQHGANPAIGNAISRTTTATPDSRNNLVARFNQMSIRQRTDVAALDYRQNDVSATQRESSWSVKMLQSLSPAQGKLFLRHISNIILNVERLESLYIGYLSETYG